MIGAWLSTSFNGSCKTTYWAQIQCFFTFKDTHILTLTLGWHWLLVWPWLKDDLDIWMTLTLRMTLTLNMKLTLRMTLTLRLTLIFGWIWLLVLKTKTILLVLTSWRVDIFIFEMHFFTIYPRISRTSGIV